MVAYIEEKNRLLHPGMILHPALWSHYKLVLVTFIVLPTFRYNDRTGDTIAHFGEMCLNSRNAQYG